MKLFINELLRCSLSMSIITLLYVIILPFLSIRYAAKWRYRAWLVIALAWLIPFRPLIELPFLPAQSEVVEFIPTQGITNTSVMETPLKKVETFASDTESNVQLFSVWEISFFLWITGVLFMLIYHIWRHLRFLKMVNRWSEKESTPEVYQLLDTLKQELKIKEKIDYKICPNINSPMMIGFLRPVILMPPIKLSENELTLILRHELTHFKRHDLWHKTVVLTATIVHWFNPFVYLMARSTSVQCEIACDSYVLKNEDMKTRKRYGETILAIIRGERTYQTVISTNFYGGKRGMKNRITSILDNKRKKTGVTILCLVLLGIVLTGATLVSARDQTASIPNTNFTQDEYKKLLALQFDGYKEMTVSEFQEKA